MRLRASSADNWLRAISRSCWTSAGTVTTMTASAPAAFFPSNNNGMSNTMSGTPAAAYASACARMLAWTRGCVN